MCCPFLMSTVQQSDFLAYEGRACAGIWTSPIAHSLVRDYLKDKK